MAPIPSFSRPFSQLVHEPLAETGRRQSPGGVQGGISRAVGIWLGHCSLSLPCHVLPQPWVWLWCPPSMTAPLQRRESGLMMEWHRWKTHSTAPGTSLSPLCWVTAVPKGAGEHRALAQVGRRVCKPFPGGCWVPGWLSWPVGCQEVEQNRAGTAAHTEAGRLPFHRPGIQHLLPSHPAVPPPQLCSYDSICPYQLIRSANEPGVFNLPFISPQVGAH